MRIIFSLISLAGLGYGGYWAHQNHPEWISKAEEIVNIGQFHTLEVRHNAKQIMAIRQRDLLKDANHKYLDPSLKFYPYVLLEVKYITEDDHTKEGVILWDLNDGEIVLNTKTWEKTHGYGDCIKAKISREEFKVLNFIAKKGNAADRASMLKSLHIESDILQKWIGSCLRKQLIVHSGNKFRLHLENPHLTLVPQTHLAERLVTMSHSRASRLPRRYSLSQIEKIAKAAFGTDFAIRSVTDIYLPVHCLSVQNPDGTIHTSHWNALNGKRHKSSTHID